MMSAPGPFLRTGRRYGCVAKQRDLDLERECSDTSRRNCERPLGRRVTSAGSSFVGKRLAEDVVLARVRIAVHGECAHHGVKYVPLAMNAL